jgi:hypothetical protein
VYASGVKESAEVEEEEVETGLIAVALANDGS